MHPILTLTPALEAAIDSGVFLIEPDRAEAQQLTGEAEEDPRGIAKSLLGRGAAEVVVVTLGAEGALVASKQTQTHIPTPEVDVVSTVGAGDSFVGALTYALANDRPLLEACRYGVAAAAATVTTEGTELAHKNDADRPYETLRSPNQGSS